jgi:sulfate permease, SulP family
VTDRAETPAWRGDLLAGVTGGILAVPQGIAFAMIANVPPEHGLYAMIVPTIIAALIRSSPFLVTGATNTAALVIGSLLASYGVAGSDGVPIMLLIVLMMGIFQIAVGALRLGDIGRYISQAVLVGFTLGAATLIFTDQVHNVLGVATRSSTRLVEEIFGLVRAAGDSDPRAIAIAASTWVILWASARISKTIPGAMIAIAASAALVTAAGWNAGATPVAMVGEIPSAFPRPTMPALDFGLARDLFGGSVAIAILGMVEAISIGKALSSQARIPFHPNLELVAKGAGNVAGAFFGCLPTSASWTRSAVNVQMGAKTRWAGAIAGASVLVIMLGFAPYARFVPKASLGAIVMWIALHMIDLPSARYVWRWSRADAAVLVITYASTLLFPIQYAIYFGVVASLVMLVRRAGRLHLVEMVAAGPRTFREIEIDEHTGEHPITLLQLEGDLFFGVVDELEGIFERIADNGTKAIVVRLKRAHAIDATAAESLADFASWFRSRGGRLVLCGLKPELHAQIARSHLGEALGEENLLLTEPQVYGSIRHAIDAVRRELVAEDELDEEERLIRPLPTDAPPGTSYAI